MRKRTKLVPSGTAAASKSARAGSTPAPVAKRQRAKRTKLSEWDRPWPAFHQGVWPRGLWQRLTPAQRRKHAEDSDRWARAEAAREAADPTPRCEQCGQVLEVD